jgi:uncharacterized protein (TIGR00251 family)
VKTAEHPVAGIVGHAKGCVISLTVAPRSSANRVELDAEGSITVRLTAPPVDGAANASLLKFLASVLDIPRSALTVLAGEKARRKRVLAEGIGDDSARKVIVHVARLAK